MTLLLRDLLGFDGNTPSGRQILQGTFTAPEGTPQHTRELFDQLKKIELSTPKPKAIITCSDFQHGWKKMKEKTSAGISGLHFGHMKTCSTDKFLSEFESALCHIPFTTSYSPESWRTNVSVMIKKKNKWNE